MSVCSHGTNLLSLDGYLEIWYFRTIFFKHGDKIQVWLESDKKNGYFIRKPMYRVILSLLDLRKCEYLKDYLLDFEHAYMTTYLASWDTRAEAGNVRQHCPGRAERDASCLRKWPARYSHFIGSSTERITLYIHDDIWLNSSQNEKYLGQNL
jgi:hypothetical protein